MFQRVVPKDYLQSKRLLVVPMIRLAALAEKGTEGIEEDKALVFEDSSASLEDTEDMAAGTEDMVVDIVADTEGIESKNCQMDSTGRTDIGSCCNCWSLGNGLTTILGRILRLVSGEMNYRDAMNLCFHGQLEELMAFLP